jgi:hypothetical protein
VKEPGRKADHLALSNVDVNNEWSGKSTPSAHSHAVGGNNCTIFKIRESVPAYRCLISQVCIFKVLGHQAYRSVAVFLSYLGCMRPRGQTKIAINITRYTRP